MIARNNVYSFWIADLLSPNSYILSTSLKLTSYQLVVGARGLQSKGMTAVVHGHSFALGPIWEGGVLGCNAAWELVVCGELANPSTFAALQDSVYTEILTLEWMQTLSLSTVFIDYFWLKDWLKGTNDEQFTEQWVGSWHWCYSKYPSSPKNTQ